MSQTDVKGLITRKAMHTKAKARLFFLIVFVFFIQIVLVSVAAAATRIMPLGDSITKGTCCSLPQEELVGYREKLYSDLIDQGYDIEFVGSQDNGFFVDPWHEGHGGEQADYIRDNIYLTGSDFLGINPADVILLHIGTNDITIDQPTTDIVDEVEQILDKIDQFEFDEGKDVPVLLALIILRTDGRNPETIALNNEVRTMAETRIAGGDNIIIVDMQKALLYPDDIDDNVHPNMTGYNKMANVWLSELEQILPFADFTSDPINEAHPLTVNFTDQSTGNITSWSWDFGDGLGTITQQNPSYTYNDPGTYTVSLTVTSPAGTDTETKTDYVVVDYIAPVANLNADPISGAYPLTVNFTDRSTGNITSWSWDFGNGSTSSSTEQNPTYTYNNAGSYIVSLTVTSLGGSDTETKTNYITVSEPTSTGGGGGGGCFISTADPWLVYGSARQGTTRAQ